MRKEEQQLNEVVKLKKLYKEKLLGIEKLLSMEKYMSVGIEVTAENREMHTMKKDLEHMKSVYEYRIGAVERIEKDKRKKLEKQ